MKSSYLYAFLSVILSFFVLMGCSKEQAQESDPHNIGFVDCPQSPNCVSSDASDDQHKIASFQTAEPLQTWKVLKSIISGLPRTEMINQSTDYLHYEFSSKWLGFVDDVKFELRENDMGIAVYSASRTGYSDFGVNRERVEKLRATLLKHGVIKE